jgi:hypothetical protein
MYPFKKLKTITKDNFVGGAIFGALFSLIVNIVTIQVQEEVQKQRTLEAIEYEIYSNLSSAGTVFEGVTKYIEEERQPEYFYTYRKYRDDLWNQSAEPRQYIMQLDPETQAHILAYYTAVPILNDIIEKIEKYELENISDCYDITVIELTDEKNETCQNMYLELRETEMNVAKQAFDLSTETLKYFHPTQDRLNNFWLRTLLGSKSIRILSRE